jgi:4-hydroxybenzoate polyprenyltransferase
VSQHASQAQASPEAERVQRPLCVDLDGTLVKSDTLYDSLCVLLRHKPASALKLPFWLVGGKARVKAELARVAPLDAARLPYNQKLLNFLRQEKRNGRAIYLVTGADERLAAAVAEHLNLFAETLGSDGQKNLTGNRKLEVLKARFGSFDYIGNASVDLPLLAASVEPMVANPSRGLLLALKARGMRPVHDFRDHRPFLKTITKAIRVHQWAKNVLIFVPLLLAHTLTRASMLAAVACFFCFSFTASANYLVNDLLDIESDRHHASKRLRPFAAGDLSVLRGLFLILLLLAAAVVLLVLPALPWSFVLWLIAYAVVTTSYSFWLKRIALVDVIVLSGLYTLRMLAGAAATGTPISPWLASFSTFLFLSLAMVKRFSEIENLRERGVATTHGRGYLVSDLEQIRSFGTASGFVAVLVFTFYISRPDVEVLYRHAMRLWLIVPLLLLWLMRVWLKASRGELDDDPVIFAIRDKMSLAIGAAVAAIALFAMWDISLQGSIEFFRRILG